MVRVLLVEKSVYEVRERREATSMMGLGSWRMARTKISIRRGSNCVPAQRKLVFDPVHIADGIELSDDPLPAVRSAVYSISYKRRNA